MIRIPFRLFGFLKNMDRALINHYPFLNRYNYPAMRTAFSRAIIFVLPALCSPLFGITGSIPAGVSSTPSPVDTPTSSPTPAPASPTPTVLTATPTLLEPLHFASGFGEDLVLEETDQMDRSTSPDWWVNSGAWFLQRGGVGSTWIGETPVDSRWRELYNQSNPRDTDQGAHPQNLFRLITRSEWLTPTQQIYFRIVGNNLSTSSNREKSNGVLLFSRYRDAQNLYYAGVRVDGSAVIKKKSGGIYTTLAEAPLYPGTYNRATLPNLIPHDAWIGLRTVMHAEGNTVTILLYTDPDRSGFWVLALQAEDIVDPAAPLAQTGYAGIRTDFMDVEFDEYYIEEPLAETFAG
jgi:hypothetical protein